MMELTSRKIVWLKYCTIQGNVFAAFLIFYMYFILQLLES